MKGGVADPGPPPLQAQMDWNQPPQQWFAGQWLPASWQNGNIATWKQVAMGEVNPWDHRIAQSLQNEWQHGDQSYGKGPKGN
eukprot:10938996-Heterocapsa_arctica.AAC.1